MKHLILVGACYLDTILTVPHFPSEDAKLRATNLNVRRGGNCPNSLEVLQQLPGSRKDVQTHLVSCLPNASSEATRRIISSFGEDPMVDFTHCIYREENTEAASSYIIRSQESGSRTIVNYNGLKEMTAAEFEKIVQRFRADQETWWHFEGRIPETTLKCFELLRKYLPQAQISVEIEKPGREGLPELAAEADVVFYSKTWAESRGHGSAESCVRNENHPKASLALCTWGADGVTAWPRETGCTISCKVESTEGNECEVVDAVGAGDTFIGGMLYVLHCLGEHDWSLNDKVWFATTLATLKVQREGFSGLGKDMLGSQWKGMIDSGHTQT